MNNTAFEDSTEIFKYKINNNKPENRFQSYDLKSTSVKKGCTKSKKTPKFGVGAIFKNYKKVFQAKKNAGTLSKG